MTETTSPATEHAAVAVTDQTFSEFTSSGLALVDFWAAWCGPCRMMAPLVEEIAQKYVDIPGVRVGKIDVDANPVTSQSLRIMSIPTFKLFHNGEVIGELIGAADGADLEALITKNLHLVQDTVAA